MNIRQRIAQRLDALPHDVFANKAHLDATLPYYVYTVSGDVAERDHTGGSGARVANFQISAYAATYKQAVQMAEQATSLVTTWSGDVQRATVGATIDSVQDDAVYQQVVTGDIYYYE